MKPAPDLLIIGASARAAAASAARAGLAPYWIDQFGDTDLRAAGPGEAVPAGDYPAGLVAAARRAPPSPYIYTGALENHGAVLAAISTGRPLLGNDAAACARARDPELLARLLDGHDIRYPEFLPAGALAPGPGWLQKPVRSGGGLGITAVEAGARCRSDHILQLQVRGESRAAVFVADGRAARLLGVTRQLVGEDWLHAGRYCYCGSLGPLSLSAHEQRRWQHIGAVLAAECGLRGLFGVDGIMDDGEPVVIEVNPRYTASVEIIDAASAQPAMALHVAACNGTLPDLPLVAAARCHGKACLFAPRNVQLREPVLAPVVAGVPLTIADIPAPGSHITAGAPVLTLLAAADGPEACARLLREGARQIYRAIS